LRAARPDETVVVGRAATLGRLAAAALAFALALAYAEGRAPEGRSLAPGDHARSFEHAGRERSHLLHAPPQTGSRPLPLVLAFHGGGGNGRGFQRYAGLDPLADRDGFLVAYPNGTHRWFDERLLTWNAGSCCGFASDAAVDDAGFALGVVEDVAAQTAVDRARVYATGHSNGAMMSYRLAAEASDRIAAIAPVAAAPALDALPTRPVPVLHVHSVDDPRALFAGGVRESFGRETRHRPVESELARWRERYGCPSQARVEIEAACPAAEARTPPRWACERRARPAARCGSGSSPARATAGPAPVPCCPSAGWDPPAT
jgi:polyhydroxybutyrate depolymerase